MLASWTHLLDIWRMQNPKQTRYTWRRGNQSSRVDFFTSFSFTPIIEKVEIKARFRSDHHLMCLSICTITFHWGIYKDKYIFKGLVTWNAFKCMLRGHCIQSSSRKANNHLEKDKMLIAEIEQWAQQIDSIADVLRRLRDNLENKKKEKAIQRKLIKNI